MTHGGGRTFFKIFTSPALTVWDSHCLEYSKLKDELMNQLVKEVIIPGFTGSVNKDNHTDFLQSRLI